MKVLWFTNTSLDYLSDLEGYNGGGWMTSLKDELTNFLKIQLGISFLMNNQPSKLEKDKTVYFPISTKRNLLSRLKRFVSKNQQEKDYISEMLRVIDTFSPDIIHVFGSEKFFGLISNYTKIPVVIHLQGIINPYYNAFLPPSFSKYSYIFSAGYSPWKSLKKKLELSAWKYSSEREKSILHSCKYFMGRTEWDKRVSKIYSPKSSYFYCSEILRREFYKSEKWIFNKNKLKLKIISVISSTPYKGQDTIIKTANILRHMNINFEWSVHGINNFSYINSKQKKDIKNLNINLMGISSSQSLVDSLLDSDVFFHPSYIENSPNSVCEAQILGLPVIACNVGGLSTIISHNHSGILIPSNDPYYGASYIKEICMNEALAKRISINSIKIATERHDKMKVLADLKSIYKRIIES